MSSTTVTEEYIYDDQGRLVKKIVTTTTSDYPNYFYPKFPSPSPWPVITCQGTSTAPNGMVTYNC